MSDTGTDVVTGAFSYTGKYIARELLDAGRTVRTITNHPDRGDPFGGRVEPVPYRFDDPVALARSLEGATTLYNTYWVRYPHDGLGFDDAVANSKLLFEAARGAGVERIVHVSVSNPRLDDPLAYYRGKARGRARPRRDGRRPLDRAPDARLRRRGRADQQHRLDAALGAAVHRAGRRASYRVQPVSADRGRASLRRAAPPARAAP